MTLFFVIVFDTLVVIMSSVIYRDLKPDNVGFDVRGDVKIFDLGLAKEIDPQHKLADGTYKLTGDTGSLRYMAPEGVLWAGLGIVFSSYH